MSSHIQGLFVSAIAIFLMSNSQIDSNSSKLIYGLDEKPPLLETIFVAIQHIVAIFLGIITPPLIICNTLDINPSDTNFILSMSLISSGIATFIQINKIGPIGSGLLSIQGSSSAFLSPVLSIGLSGINNGIDKHELLGLIFCLCLLGAFVEIIFSFFIREATKIITPLVTGIVVMLIGLTLIKFSVLSIGGGLSSQIDGTFGNLKNLTVACVVIFVTIIFYNSKILYLRMFSILIGLLSGIIVSIPLHLFNSFNFQNLPLITVPVPFKFGFSFNLEAFIPFLFIYIIVTIESIGDLTATSSISQEPIEGEIYINRLKGGVLGDGVNSILAACFNTFPNTTFSQNNGVIQLTGVGSRYVGYFIAFILVLLGFFPSIANILQSIPQPVMGGVTMMMFTSIAMTGFRILCCVNLNHRNSTIIAISLGMGLGVTFIPEILNSFPLMLQSIFDSGVTTGGIVAMFFNIILPEEL